VGNQALGLGGLLAGGYGREAVFGVADDAEHLT
jgi:hypothetical protein